MKQSWNEILWIDSSVEKNGKGWKRKGRERERQLEIEMERGIERKRNEVVNCDRISTNGVVENTCVFFEY